MWEAGEENYEHVNGRKKASGKIENKLDRSASKRTKRQCTERLWGETRVHDHWHSAVLRSCDNNAAVSWIEWVKLRLTLYRRIINDTDDSINSFPRFLHPCESIPYWCDSRCSWAVEVERIRRIWRFMMKQSVQRYLIVHFECLDALIKDVWSVWLLSKYLVLLQNKKKTFCIPEVKHIGKFSTDFDQQVSKWKFITTAHYFESFFLIFSQILEILTKKCIFLT